MRDRLQLVFAPVLRAHNDRALACTDDQHLQQKLHLIAQAYAAHGILTVPPEHHGVHQVYAVGEQVLQRQRQCQHHKGFIKRLFLYHYNNPLPSKLIGRNEPQYLSFRFSFFTSANSIPNFL